MAVAAFVVLYFGFFRSAKKPTYEMITSKRGDLVQEVSVTGRTKPAQSVDMQFEASGRVAAINYKAGDKIKAGTVILSLDNQDLKAQVLEKEGALEAAKADLDKTIKNFNSLNDSNLSTSLRTSLQNAQSNLDQVQKKAAGDLATKYNSAFNMMREGITQLDSGSIVLENMRTTYFSVITTWNSAIQDYQKNVASYVSQARSAFPGIDQANITINTDSYNQIDASLQKLTVACQYLTSAYGYIQDIIQGPGQVSSTDRTTINTEASTMASTLSDISSAGRAVADQKILNDKNVSDAQAQLASAQSAFPTQEDIAQKNAAVKQAQAALLAAQAQLNNSLVIAPFDGVVGKIDVDLGQTVNSSTIVASMISSAGYQLEADITEVDISKLHVGESAVFTLDSYGQEVKFNAKVTAIDTSETVIEGVTTYKTTLDLADAANYDIRPNMTANIDVETARKADVISIPQRAVITKNGVKLIRIYHGAKLPLEERSVQLGITGKDGYVEVVSGLSEGEQVITFVTN